MVVVLSQERSYCSQLWNHHSLAGFGGSPGPHASFGQCLLVCHTCPPALCFVSWYHHTQHHTGNGACLAWGFGALVLQAA